MALGRVVESGVKIPQHFGSEGEPTEGVSFLRDPRSTGHSAEAPLDAL